MNIEVGLKYTSETVVETNITAKAVGSGDLDVFATPSMIALMESAAMNSVCNALAEGATTVGTKIEVSHIRATPLSVKVEATATLTEIDGRRLIFKIEARDDKGVIGEGNHERFIVDKERFMSKL